MASERWQRIEELFHATLQLEAAERAGYLSRECLDDDELRKEVESLISASENSPTFIDKPELNLGMRVLSSESSNSLIGKSVGPYKIVSALGKGGMGEVYLAEDTKLGRKVALKFLSAEFVGDNWAKRQLIKEAQAVAMLDHQNICPVYGIEEDEGHSYIVMQYVEGETLSELIRAQRPDPTQVLALAKQIVGALAEAHAHGIIHRDIKPKNIMVTPGGQVKVLDFGLAKTMQKKGLDGGEDSVSHLSQSGLVPGTVAYMSPEQLRGEKLDYRSDVFSVGTVLYETITGKNPYAHETNADIISAILTTSPASFKKTSAPPLRELDRIVQKCLEKERSGRYQSAGDLLLDLEASSGVLHGRRHVGEYVTVRTAATAALLSLLVIVSLFIYFQVTRPKSVAVLPIVNESGDAALEYLGDGLTESITNRLFGLSKLLVKPATLVSGYKKQPVDPQKVGRDLGVDAVLVGTISGSKELPILQVRLLSVGNGSQLWQEQYGIDQLKSVFSIEEDVSQRVISKLEFRSGEDARRVKIAQGPQNPEARKHYWLGRYYWKNRDNNNTLNDAIQHFNAAIALEPTYAQAHAGLADCYAFWNVVAYGQMDTREAMTKAERAARDAIELDGTLPEAHTSLATVNLKYYWDWQEAENEFRSAISINPDYAPAHYGYSTLLTIRGRNEEAIAQGRIAKDLDPFSPATALNYCRTLFFARQFSESTICYDKLVQDHPDYATGRYVRSWVYFHLGRYDEAIATFEELYAKDKRLAGAALGYAYGQRGRRADAERVLKEMVALSESTHLPPQEIALIYFGMGDMDHALIWFQQSAAAHFAPFSFLLVDPMFEKLREDPRFMTLARTYDVPFPHPSR
jgi:serine/threonine-protein kinase